MCVRVNKVLIDISGCVSYWNPSQRDGSGSHGWCVTCRQGLLPWSGVLVMYVSVIEYPARDIDTPFSGPSYSDRCSSNTLAVKR